TGRERLKRIEDHLCRGETTRPSVSAVLPIPTANLLRRFYSDVPEIDVTCRPAAPWLARQQQAERRAPVRPPDRVGPRPGHAQPHSGAESRSALRLRQVGVTQLT